MKKPLVVAIIFLMEKIKTFFIKNNYLIPILFLIFGLGVFFYPMFLNFDKMPGDLGDARFINFILEHYYQYINNNPIHDRFWVLPMHHPLKNTLAYSDLLLGCSFLYVPFRYIFNAQTAFQIFLVLVCSLNYISFYFLSKKIFKFSTFFASFASFIFCFSLPRHAQTYHLQLFVQFFMILSILSFALISKENSKLKNKILFSFGLLFFVLQFYSAYYFAWFMVFSIPILLISFLSTKRTRVILKNWLKCFDFSYVPIILAFFVSMLPLCIHYLLINVKFAKAQTLNPIFFLISESKLNSFFFDFSYFHEQENLIGMGFLTTILILVGVFKNKYKIPIILFLSSVILIFTNNIIYSKLYDIIPFLSSIRAISRFIFLLLPIYAVILTFYLSKIKSMPILIILLGLILFEQIPKENHFHWNKIEHKSRIEKFNFPNECKVVAYKFNAKNQLEHAANNLDIMWYSSISDKRTINGYTFLILDTNKAKLNESCVCIQN